MSLLTIRASAFCGGETRGKEEGIAGREAIAPASASASEQRGWAEGQRESSRNQREGAKQKQG